MEEDKRLKYRHEFKYPVSENELALIKNRILGIASRDPHVGNNGIYNISSLYFDDIYDTCMMENEVGADPREKFRVRIYNHETRRITLECKRKERGKTLKTSCPLTLEQAEIISAGGYLQNIGELSPLLTKFTLQMMERNLRPKIIVEYDREPFVYTAGNVRITFDRNLCSSKETGKFLEGSVRKRPVMPAGKSLLEVKYDEYLPDYLYRALQIDNLTQTAYSKYYLCRKYTL